MKVPFIFLEDSLYKKGSKIYLCLFCFEKITTMFTDRIPQIFLYDAYWPFYLFKKKSNLKTQLPDFEASCIMLIRAPFFTIVFKK